MPGPVPHPVIRVSNFERLSPVKIRFSMQKGHIIDCVRKHLKASITAAGCTAGASGGGNRRAYWVIRARQHTEGLFIFQMSYPACTNDVAA